MTLKEELEKLNDIAHSGAPDAEERYMALSQSITSRYTSPDDTAEIARFLTGNYQEMIAEADGMLAEAEKIKALREMKEIIPISYIARHYFGKSASWLQQRLYGYKVRGRVYTLSEEDKRTFDNALQDIGKRICSLSIA